MKCFAAAALLISCLASVSSAARPQSHRIGAARIFAPTRWSTRSFGSSQRPFVFSRGSFFHATMPRSFTSSLSYFQGSSSRGFGWGMNLKGNPPKPKPTTPAESSTVYVPGQLVRTAGLGFTETAGGPTSLLTVEAGNRIQLDGNAQAVTNAPGVFTGRADALPPPNPSNGGSVGGTSIVENSNAQ